MQVLDTQATRALAPAIPGADGFLEFRQYPQALYDAEVELLDLAGRLALLRSALAAENAAIEQFISTNSELRNEQQRKAEKLALQQADQYQGQMLAIQMAQNLYDLQGANLARLRNEFKVLQLEAQLKIAGAE